TRYVDGDVGLPTLRDIVTELRKPGRDPRAAFEPPAFREDVQKPEDLVAGMVLEGVVTNIVAFGAFVDIGVHQDGLVHVSQLADRYVRDPNDVVRVGQKVQVTVQSIDLARGRIALTMRKDGGAKGAGASAARRGAERGDGARGDASRDGASRDGASRDGASRDGASRSGAQRNGRPRDGGADRRATPVVPTKGFVAPNGMRFK
ncbi:MAG TPA: S1 RNA-binding domain-containing protein, partial [Gemmatimonadaceae bacterium]|nr:S1 RNA-binding domain-containing protein [Gemmatimonadaceae bacterium]